jgi:hypothetical protein
MQKLSGPGEQITRRTNPTLEAPQVYGTEVAGNFFLSRYCSRAIVIACIVATFAVCDRNLMSLHDLAIIIRVPQDTPFTLFITLDVTCTKGTIVCLNFGFCAQPILCAWSVR